MPKPVARILSGDPGQRLNDCLLECFTRASAHSSQDGFQLGKGFFNGREVRRIRRQEQQLTAFGFDGVFHARTQVNGKVVQDHDLSGAQEGRPGSAR